MVAQEGCSSLTDVRLPCCAHALGCEVRRLAGREEPHLQPSEWAYSR